MTALTILLPDPLGNNFTLKDGVSANSRTMLENFRESLQKLSDNEIEQWFNDAAQVQWN